jgi:hypothetical protein
MMVRFDGVSPRLANIAPHRVLSEQIRRWTLNDRTSSDPVDDWLKGALEETQYTRL